MKIHEYQGKKIFSDYDNLLIGARRGSPLAIGRGDNENFLASDAIAMAPLTRRISYLKDGDIALLRPGALEIYDVEEKLVKRVERETSYSGDVTGKAGYRHFMQKEIHEQPSVIPQTISAFLNDKGGLSL